MERVATPLRAMGARIDTRAGTPPVRIHGGAALRGPQAATLKDDDLIPRWPSTSLINVVVVGGQTNPYYQVANMSYSKSVSIDKWM